MPPDGPAAGSAELARDNPVYRAPDGVPDRPERQGSQSSRRGWCAPISILPPLRCCSQHGCPSQGNVNRILHGLLRPCLYRDPKLGAVLEFDAFISR